MKEDTFSSTFASNARLSSDDVIRSIETNLPSVDATRTQSYGQLALMRDAKASSLTKEQRLLAIKNGGSHPRIAQAAEAFESNENLRREIAVVREVVETVPPEVDEKTFVVYGFVRRRSTQAGIPGLTLALTDEQGNWIKQFGYACTDKRGYFELQIKRIDTQKDGSTVTEKTNLTEEEKKKLAEEKARAAASGAAPASSIYTSGAAAASATTERVSLSLRVFNRDGRTLHTEKNPVVLKAGALDYRVILLGDDAEACGCTPPPDQTDGKPTHSGPPTDQRPTPSVPTKPAPAASPLERVGGLKSYQAVPPPVATGQPLEAIRGIGPKGAEKLRAAGISDVAAFEKTAGQKLVDIAGFDKTPPKASEVPKEKPAPHVEKAPKTAEKHIAAKHKDPKEKK